ncbi:MAG: xanthine dehydrogenase family protein molybdopterin-binding subunit, partial [Rhizobiales bacterium]|nr:xanthine dehydrogenase family protein molybdopterin-binding subunit [Hyphomicrobiales bacterium]
MGITRRIFVVGGAILGGAALTGLGIGTGYLSTIDVEGMTPSAGEGGSVNLNTWINIGTDDVITIHVPFLEMGQGTHTGLAQLVAEELELDLAAGNIRVMHPDQEFSAHTNWAMFLNKRPQEMTGPISWYAKRFMATMKLSATGGSTAVVGSWDAMRQAGAVAREMLRTAAADHLKTDPAGLQLEHGAFKTADGSQSVSFGKIAQAAAKLEPPAQVALKPASEFKVIGRPVPRVDVPGKIAGAGRFGIDVRLPDMMFATVRQAPVFGATIAGLNDAAARAMRGVIDVIKSDDAVIVVADNTWRAFQAAEALEITYDAPGEPAPDDYLADIAARMARTQPTQTQSRGDAAGALTASEKTVEAEYRTPFLAHATLEPMNSTVLWKTDDTVEIWAPTQSAAMTRQVIEKIGGANSIKVNVTLAGGGFGRRAEKNFTVHAAIAAKAHKGRPVQLTWSRAEDMQHDVYRPAAIARMKAGLSANGQLLALDTTIGTHSVMDSFLPRNMDMANMSADASTLEGIAHTPYRISDAALSVIELETPVPLGFWRSVGHSNNAFFVESIIDECAHAAGNDPMTFRLANVDLEKPRHKLVLETLRDKANWQGPGGNGKGRGIALHESFRSTVGMVIDVEVDDDK